MYLILMHLNATGLALNFVGTLFLVFTYSLDKDEYVTGEGKHHEERWYSVLSKHPIFLKIGIALIAMGFLLSLIDSLFASQYQATTPAQQTNITYTATLDVQAICATQAQKTFGTFKEQFDPINYGGFRQQNHYNQKMNKCFVLISFDNLYDGGSSEYLLDTYENKQLASRSLDIINGKNITSYSLGTLGHDYSIVDQKKYSDFVKIRMELD